MDVVGVCSWEGFSFVGVVGVLWGFGVCVRKVLGVCWWLLSFVMVWMRCGGVFLGLCFVVLCVVYWVYLVGVCFCFVLCLRVGVVVSLWCCFVMGVCVSVILVSIFP